MRPFDGEAFSLCNSGPIFEVVKQGAAEPAPGRAVGLSLQVAQSPAAGFHHLQARCGYDLVEEGDMGTLDYTREGGGLCQNRVSSGFHQGEWSNPHPSFAKGAKEGCTPVSYCKLVKRLRTFDICGLFFADARFVEGEEFVIAHYGAAPITTVSTSLAFRE